MRTTTGGCHGGAGDINEKSFTTVAASYMDDGDGDDDAGGHGSGAVMVVTADGIPNQSY